MRYDSEVRQAIARWAPAYGVSIPVELVHAIIEQESTHGRTLVSEEPGGRRSYGPMMVLDTTAKGELGIADPRVMAENAALGISAGVRYLAKMLQRFRGDVRSAVSAYNAGAGGVGRNPGYVAKVLGYFNLYRAAAPSALGLVVLGVAAWALLGRKRRRAA